MRCSFLFILVLVFSRTAFALDPYSILGIQHTADTATIRAAFKILAKRFHPDLRPNDEAASENFKKVTAAYTLLNDQALRARYDRGELSLTHDLSWPSTWFSAETERRPTHPMMPTKTAEAAFIFAKVHVADGGLGYTEEQAAQWALKNTRDWDPQALAGWLQRYNATLETARNAISSGGLGYSDREAADWALKKSFYWGLPQLKNWTEKYQSALKIAPVGISPAEARTWAMSEVDGTVTRQSPIVRCLTDHLDQMLRF